jgi:hypothetical protein
MVLDFEDLEDRLDLDLDEEADFVLLLEDEDLVIEVDLDEEEFFPPRNESPFSSNEIEKE